MANESKKIEIVSGDTSDLNISPVYEHLHVAKPKKKAKKNVVVPKVNKKNSNK